MGNIVPGCLCRVVNSGSNNGMIVTTILMAGDFINIGGGYSANEKNVWRTDREIRWVDKDKKNPSYHKLCPETCLQRIDDGGLTKKLVVEEDKWVGGLNIIIPRIIL